jgi:hypothetical protein
MCIDTSWLPLVLDRGCLGLSSREVAPELTHGAHRTSKTPTISAGQVTKEYPGLLKSVSK